MDRAQTARHYQLQALLADLRAKHPDHPAWDLVRRALDDLALRVARLEDRR